MGLLYEGQIVRGTYEVERFLGEGAFAEVFRVKHRFLGRQAMKVFKTVGMTADETETMLGEAILLSRIGHPNIVRVFDANTTDTSRGHCGFFTMEYVAGGSLEQFWASFGNRFVPLEISVDILRQICRGLSVAHSEQPPIIHRDIKPQNILVGYDGSGLRVRVSDFGLAKQVNPLTLMASARGTRCFKAPEAFRDPQCDSCAGDVWALGSLLYLLLTDRLPYAEPDSLDAAESRQFDREIIPASRLNIQVDPFLEGIVTRSLAMQPEKRYGSAREMLGDLMKWSLRPVTPAAGPKQVPGSDVSKSALGLHSPVDEKHAREMVDRAVRLARETGMLNDAADMLEEAFNKWPDLRIDYASQLQLWRRGVTM
jgi:eukaryotic-like serine/threonine-protein kinase